MRLAVLAGALAIGVFSQANARESAPLQPRGGWVLDYAEERCALYRTFGRSDNSLHFRIDAFGSPAGYRVNMWGAEIPRFNEVMTQADIRLNPDTEPRDREPVMTGRIDAFNAVSYNMAFTPDFSRDDPPQSNENVTDAAAQEAMIAARRARGPVIHDFRSRLNELEISFRGRKTIRINLGEMAPPLQALTDCVDDLQRHWGLDTTLQKTLRRNPVPLDETIRRLLRSYPPSMVRGGQNAYVPVRIMVDATGAVTDCVVQADSTKPEFREAVCDGLGRGFDPALDADGTPVASIFQISIVFTVR